MEICFRKKKPTKNKKTKKRKNNFLRRESNPGPPPCAVNALSIAPRQLICPWNSPGRRCLQPVEHYLWRIERYIQGKQAWFLQLKLYCNSFCHRWGTYGRQVSRKIVANSLAACDPPRLHEENHLRFSNSKHFRFYWTKKHFISEWYFTQNHEIGSLVVTKVKTSWDSRQNRKLGQGLRSSF